MRIVPNRRTGTSTVIGATALLVLLGAGASAASIFVGAVDLYFGKSFPDPGTWALMLLSFGLIGAGVRSRRRSVVIA